MQIKKYINEHLDSILLEPPLFYNSEVGIRYELGLSDTSIDNSTYFEVVKNRALSLFNAIFRPSQQIYIVVVTYESIETLDAYLDNEVDFSETFLNDSHIQNIEEIKKAEVYDDDTSELIGYSRMFGVSCYLNEIDYIALLGALGGFSEKKEYVYDRVYFVDPERHIIFHIYDSRGLDIVALDKEAIVFLYRDYNDWILD